MPCAADQRDRVRRAARWLDERPGVVAVDHHPPDAGPTPHWSLECLLQSGGVPSAVLTELGAAGLELRDSVAVGPHWRFVAVAE